MDLHARYSPSQLPRIIACPGSVQLTKSMPRESSEYAKEGTMLHAVIEESLTLNELVLPGTIITQYSLDQDQQQACQDVLDWVFALRATYADYDYVESVESKVSLAEYNAGAIICPQLEDVAGTLDYCFKVPELGLLIAADWKFGKGVEVFPDSEQLKAYTLGKLKNAATLLSYNKIQCVIGQPRLYSGELFKTEDYEPHQLLSWLKKELVPALQEAESRNPRFGPSEKACRFCAAKYVCEERHKSKLQAATEVFAMHAKLPNRVDHDELAALLFKFDDLRTYMKDMEDYASAQIQKGLGFPKWKLVAGRSNRIFAFEKGEEDGFVEFLEEQGVDTSECYKDPEFKSVAQIEKVVGRKLAQTEEFKAFVIKPEGKATLVPEYDKRQPLNFTTPQEAFASFAETEEE